ncbi:MULTISPECIES: hypothetical protein [unclassified Streptomyces]|uniref:hypothetical protein n=1 Tax=unclassified Streptomyces TaxID=2593676 RepID=UPI002DDA8FC7|nr:hypothetical protein [Streptomyces sp. NBC_01766]WSC20610.1 hypothetical protein OIE60_13430 [Streptomyces sp. NBC_01766]WSV54639.1 hypothetical protein OG282_13485 [Streptomyces sp. NBC_01014]
MSDLTVDDSLLLKSARSLKKIQYEFEHTEDHQEDLKHIWGAQQIASAMDDFADNWSYHRKQLLESIKTVGTLTEKCHESFQELDHRLEKSTKPSGAKKRAN